MTTVPEPTARRRLPVYALVAAYFVSVAGTAMSALAIPWLVLTTTGSATQTGLVVFAEMTPYVVMQAMSGPWVDRWGAHRACARGNGVAAVAIGAIPVLQAVDLLSVGALLALVAVAGAVRGMSDCANTALVPGAAAVAAMPLERAAGLNSGANQAGFLLGAPLAGLLLALVDASTVVLIDAVSFALAAVLIGALVPASVQPSRATDESSRLRYFAQLAEGFGHLRRDRLLLTLATMIAVTNLLDQALVSVLLPVWVQEQLGEPVALGLIIGAGGVGALLGNLIGAWLGPRLPRRAAYAVGFLIGGAPIFIVLAVSSSLWPPLTMSFVGGLSNGAINPILAAVCFERIPPALLARVMGVVKASAWVGIPFGPLLGGLLIEGVGLRPALLIAAAVFFVATLPPFVLGVFRQMNRSGDQPGIVVASER